MQKQIVLRHIYNIQNNVHATTSGGSIHTLCVQMCGADKTIEKTPLAKGRKVALSRSLSL